MSASNTLIIGAGAAGLAAALCLSRAGIDVTILEARDRIGGRAWSIDAPGCPLPIDIGPEWVHGRPEVSLRLLRRYGIKQVETADQSWVMDGGVGALEADDEQNRITALMLRAAAALPPGLDISLIDALHAVATPADGALIEAICSMAKGFDAADPHDASFRAIHEEWQGDASLKTASSRIDGGYRRLWQNVALEAQNLGAKCIFNTPVTRIFYDANGVTLSIPDGRQFRASRCVITVPLAVLKRQADDGGITFSPPLPADRLVALGRLAMGPVIKAHGVFAEPFWEALQGGRYRDAGFFRAPTSAPFRILWTTRPRESNLLTAWAGGSDVKGPLLAGDAEITAAFFATIEAVFGAAAGAVARAACRWSAVWNWPREAYTHGAYSYARVDGLSARSLLAQPLAAQLYFAGEAYAGRGEAGTVAGALETGEAAAAAIIAALEKKVSS